MIAIILINYNNSNDTIKCVKSIKESEGINLPYLVVIDNNSNVKNIHEVLSFYPPRKTIYNDENMGFGRANNQGINWAIKNLNPEFIFLLNNDTTLDKFCLKNLVEHEYWERGENYLLAPLILNMDNPPTVWYGGGDIDWNRGSAKMDYIGYSADHDVIKNQRNVTFASGCAMFFNTSFLKELGGFDPFFFMYEEDVDLSTRTQKLGGQIIFFPLAIVYHKCQGASTIISETKNQLDPNNPNLTFNLKNLISGRIYNMRKHANIKHSIYFFFYSFIFWNAKFIQFIVNKKFKASLRIYEYLIKSLLKINF